MGGGNGQKAKMARAKNLEKMKFGSIGSQLEANKKSMSIQVSLGPLMYASKFVLVGAHYQLPPLVQSTESLENGMGVSLFCRLSGARPLAIAALQNQYCMCASIMELSDALIYGNRLCCGSSEVENAKLKCTSSKYISSWLKEVLDPNRPVIFINTDMLPALEAKDGKTVNNPVEANIIVEGLVNKGIEIEDIGISTPYNSGKSHSPCCFLICGDIPIDKYQYVEVGLRQGGSLNGVWWLTMEFVRVGRFGLTRCWRVIDKDYGGVRVIYDELVMKINTRERVRRGLIFNEGEIVGACVKVVLHKIKTKINGS